ncbi:MAG: hypothetical protein ACI923_002054 [Flavobacteriales bacterium]|jgi:hypothetical protein
MLVFFDFYPIISKSDSFFDLYSDAFFWAFWQSWNIALVGVAVLFSRTLSRTFSTSTLSWAFFIGFFGLYGLGMIEYLIREAFEILRGTGKLSDQLLFVTENVMVMGVIILMLLLAHVIFNGKKSAHSIPAFSQRFQSLTKWRQRILLALLFITFFNYPFLHFPALLIALIGLGYYWMKNVVIVPIQHVRKWRDLLPFLFVTLLLALLSPFILNTVLNAVPLLKNYF